MDPIKNAPLRIHDIRSKYKIIDKVGKGTYGTVFKVLNLQDNKYYAIKKFQNTQAKLQVQGFPITALRQISLLKQLNHPNIVNLQQIICSKPNKRNLYRGSCFMVFEYMHHDFAGLFRSKVKFTMPQVKSIMKQIIEGCGFLHKNKVMHRDIKSANILMNDHGVVQVADFGLGRRTRFDSIYTYKVVTLWYRAPELLLGCKSYNHKVDVWSIGCVFAELLTGEVLFKKQTEYAIIEKIYEICGDLDTNEYTQEYLKGCVYYNDMKHKKPSKNTLQSYIRKMCPDIDSVTINFLQGLLELNPYRRLSCEEALEHDFFKREPKACEPEQIQKLDVEYHQMFRDRSLKIERKERKPSLNWSEQEEKRKIKDQPKQEKPYKQDDRYAKPYIKNERDRYQEKTYQKPRYPTHRDDKYEERKPDYPKRDYPFSDRKHQQQKPRKKYQKSPSKSRSSSSSSRERHRNRDYRKNQNQNKEERQYYRKQSGNYQKIKVEISISKKQNDNHSYPQKEREKYRSSEKEKQYLSDSKWVQKDKAYRKDSISYKEERYYNEKSYDYKERDRKSPDRRDSDRRQPNRRSQDYNDRRNQGLRGPSRYTKESYDKSYSKYSPSRQKYKEQTKSKSYTRQKYQSGEYRSRDQSRVYDRNPTDRSDRYQRPYTSSRPKEYSTSRKQYPPAQKTYQDRKQYRSPPQRQGQRQRQRHDRYDREYRNDRQYRQVRQNRQLRQNREYEKSSYDYHKKQSRLRDDSRYKEESRMRKRSIQRQRSTERKKYSPRKNLDTESYY